MKVFLIACMLLSISAASLLSNSILQDEQRKAPLHVRRAPRPVFVERDGRGIFFDNVFEDALVGDRPSPLAIAEHASSGTPANTNTEQNSDIVGDGEAFAWSGVISGDVLETEIKRLQRRLATEVTSPNKFKTGYPKARYTFDMLSMLFGIVHAHDDEAVRWKRASSIAQPGFAAAARNARRGDSDSFRYAEARRDDLNELVRGGNMNSNEKPVDQIVWSEVVDRSPIMVRLGDSVEALKPMLADADAFMADVEEVVHEASLVAAMANILARESMDDAEEPEYVEYSDAMLVGAKAILDAAKTGNYDAASLGFNEINQSCSNCHDAWR